MARFSSTVQHKQQYICKRQSMASLDFCPVSTTNKVAHFLQAREEEKEEEKEEGCPKT